MASRLRWLVILGPPLIVVIAAGAIPRSVPPVIAGTLATPAGVTNCPSADPAGGSAGAATAATWWTQEPDLDEAGTLTGWTLTLGSPQGATLSMALPAGSIVTGPTGGRVVAATDDGTASVIVIIDVGRRCSQRVPVDWAVARRAALDPGGDAIIAHLIDRETRRDLGIWRISIDGLRREALLPPIADAVLGSAGIDRVWATDLRLSEDGTLLAIQSCDPDACVTRILDLRSAEVTTLDAPHGAFVGFSGRFLITEAGCAGNPCDILSWDLTARRSNVVATGVIGAAVSSDGRLVVATMDADGAAVAAVTEPGTGHGRSLGFLEPGAVPLGGSGTSGIDTPPGAIGLARAGGPPSVLVIDPPANSNREVEP